MASRNDSVHHVHPVTAAMLAQRAESARLRPADRITACAGSMPFVYFAAAATELHRRVVVEGGH